MRASGSPPATPKHRRRYGCSRRSSWSRRRTGRTRSTSRAPVPGAATARAGRRRTHPPPVTPRARYRTAPGPGWSVRRPPRPAGYRASRGGLSAACESLAANGGQADQVDATAVGIQDAETIRADFGDFITLGQVSERTHHQAADGVELIIGEFAVEELVEVLDRRQCLDQEVAAG